MWFYNPNDRKYEVWRDGQQVGIFLGVKSTERGKTYIDFHSLVDVHDGDIIVTPENGSRFSVTHIDSDQTNFGYVHRYYRAFIIPCTLMARYQPVTIETLTLQVQVTSPTDQTQLDELIAVLKQIAEGTTPPKKGALHKFGDLLTKYAPLATSVGQILVQILTSQ